MPESPEFTLRVIQNPYLAESARQLHAFVNVTARGEGGPGGPAAEVLLIDCSSSMDFPPTKIAAARRACAAAVHVLRDGTLFAVISGTSTAKPVYPPSGLAVADERTRQTAKAEIATLPAVGGTAIGTWLAEANRLLAAQPDAVRHALLLTDGKNQHETRAELDAVLSGCEGNFVCDARGIGDGWEPGELLRIASVLRGTAEAVPDESRLAGEFTRLTAAAMDKVVADVRLRVTAMPYSALRFVKQVHPFEYDLTDRTRDAGERAVELSTGSWSNGQAREYHLCFDLDPAGPRDFGQERQLGTVALVPADGVRVPARPGVITGRWTHDQALITKVGAREEHYREQAELIVAMDEGRAAFDAGDKELARDRWGRAVRLATELDHDDLLAKLASLVETVDARAGDVRLRPDIGRSAIFDAMLGSRQSRIQPLDPRDPEPQPPAPAPGPSVTCPNCDRICPPGAKFCTRCGHRFAGESP